MLDALHMNPTTTAQINLAGGIYIIQVKDNYHNVGLGTFSRSKSFTWS